MSRVARVSWEVIRRCLEIALAMTLAWLAVSATAPAVSAAQRKPSHPKWESNNPFGSWSNGGFIVYNNEWNTSAAGPQTIWADSYHHWGVTTDQAQTTAVKTYPCVQKDYKNIPYTRLTYLRSAFTQSMPSTPNLDAEAAYDVWLNNYKIEVMMWVDNVNQTPAGPVFAHVNIYGEHWAVYRVGRPFFTFVLSGKPQTTGKVHLLSALRWLVKHHYLHKDVKLTQENFGWEIAASGGKTNFTVTKYWLETGVRKH
jgi:hypothetical protein